MSFCANRNVALLKELRYVASETGLAEARRMPREVRQWWINEMTRDREADDEALRNVRAGNVRSVDVPRGKAR